MKHNPIIKAMTPDPIIPPKPVAVPKKKQAPAQNPGISFSREVDIITAPKRAMDYEPPASFLQNMDRPVRDHKVGAKGNVLADLWS